MHITLEPTYYSLPPSTHNIHRLKFWFKISHIKCKLLPRQHSEILRCLLSIYTLLKFKWKQVVFGLISQKPRPPLLCAWTTLLMKFSWGYCHIETRPCQWSDWLLWLEPQPRADKGFWLLIENWGQIFTRTIQNFRLFDPVTPILTTCLKK